mmetsp:Transcript_6149/g.9392  ORF Transcript_6149/g.9392 Transcript_6149/m.9392 type:complete len:509 (+) Transcript_6149:1170-2696(+)
MTIGLPQKRPAYYFSKCNLSRKLRVLLCWSIVSSIIYRGGNYLAKGDDISIQNNQIPKLPREGLRMSHYTERSYSEIDEETNVVVQAADSEHSAVEEIDPHDDEGVVQSIKKYGSWTSEHSASSDRDMHILQNKSIDSQKLDEHGKLYYFDPYQSNVTTLAGIHGEEGYVDGAWDQAKFFHPCGIAVSQKGIVYIADTGNNRIRKIDLDQQVNSLVGSGIFGYRDGDASRAKFHDPMGIAVLSEKDLVVADNGNKRLRIVQIGNPPPCETPSHVETLLKIGKKTSKSLNFEAPCDVFLDSENHILVADSSRDKIKRISPDLSVTSVKVCRPLSVCADMHGSVYTSDCYSNEGEKTHTVVKVSRSGKLYTYAGTGYKGMRDGHALDAQFFDPKGIAVNRDGHVFVCDSKNRRIRRQDIILSNHYVDYSNIHRISPNGFVTTVAGNIRKGSMDGPGSLAEFSRPERIAIDKNGNLYVTDIDNHNIRKITFGNPKGDAEVDAKFLDKMSKL